MSDRIQAFVERRATPLAAALLALLLLQGLVFITESSQTSDEAAHLAAGYSYLTTGDYRLNTEHPPLIKLLAALPLLPLRLDFPGGLLWDQAEEWNIGRIFVHENRVSNDTLLLLGRLPVLLLSILLGWALYRFGLRLFGAPGALLALALYVLDPNVVAHSGLVTTDLGITLFMFLSVYALWCWSERPSRRPLVLLGLSVGGAFAAKYTAVWIVPILLALGGALLVLGVPLPRRPLSRSPDADGPRAESTGSRLGALFQAAALVVVIAFAVLALSYAVIGLPAYLVGLEQTVRHSAQGHRAFLMGSLSETGWWYYFPFAWLIKTPPGTLLLMAAAIGSFFLGRRLRPRHELFLALPILMTLLLTSVFRVNIGLRHILPIYPFLFLFAGRLLLPPAGGPSTESRGPSWRRGASFAPLLLVAAGLAVNVVEAARIAPYHLAYFNALVGGPSRGHLFLLDSNLDWGQAAKALRRFVVAERLPMIYCAFSGNTDPFYYGVPYQYAPGSGNLLATKQRPARMPADASRELFAISAMVRHSVHFSAEGLYDWLDSREPVAMPGYAFLVYDITGDPVSHSNLALLCLNFKLYDLAEFEAGRALSLDPENELARAVLDELRARGPDRPPLLR